MKTCPSCQMQKPLTSFYTVKSRADGLASWCKLCSNQSRKLYRKSERRPEYRVVANLVKQGVKPHECGGCNAQNVPAYLMRGLMENGQVTWRCQRCHLTTIKAARVCRLAPQAAEALVAKPKRSRRPAVEYCDWCCDSFLVGTGIPEGDACGPFCGAGCREACYTASRTRSIESWRQSSQSSSSSESSSERVTRTLVGTPSSSSSSTSKSSASISAPSGAGMS